MTDDEIASDEDIALVRGLAEQACDKYAPAPRIGPFYGEKIAQVLNALDALRRERDETYTRLGEAIFAQSKTEHERDAALALLRVAKVELENAWRREEWAPDSTADALNRIDALLGDGAGGA